MGKKRYERQVLLIKEEANEGVDSTPSAAANSIPYFETIVPEIDHQQIDRGNPLDSLSPVKSLAGNRSIKLGFKSAFYGGGAAATPPRFGDVLEMCGFLETINAATSVVYTPASANLKTATIYQYFDGLLFKSLGSVGTLKVGGKVGEPIFFEVQSQGLYQDDADSALVTPQYGSNFNTPPQMKGITFTLDSIGTFILHEFNLDMGQAVIPRPDAKSVDGFAGFMLGKRNGSGNIIIELESKATYDFMAKMEAATQLAANITTAAVAGNTLAINFNFTIGAPKIENAGGLAILNLPVKLCRSADAGNDEITFTQT